MCIQVVGNFTICPPIANLAILPIIDFFFTMLFEFKIIPPPGAMFKHPIAYTKAKESHISFLISVISYFNYKWNVINTKRYSKRLFHIQRRGSFIKITLLRVRERWKGNWNLVWHTMKIKLVFYQIATLKTSRWKSCKNPWGIKV